MIDLLICIIVPLIISNTFHIVLVKENLFAYLAVPVSEPLFGQNKTWRGFVIVPFLNAFILLVICLFKPYFPLIYACMIGFLFGMTYMLFELPNSYLKRRLGIVSGGKAKNYRWLFMLSDKTDSSFGVSLFSYYFLNLSLLQTLQLFFICILTHILFSCILVATGIKKSF